MDCTRRPLEAAAFVSAALVLMALPACHKGGGKEAPAEVVSPSASGDPQPEQDAQTADGQGVPSMTGPSIQLTSPAFRDQHDIPAQYTCEGEGGMPTLNWSGIPASAKSLALVMDDPDAPNGTWVHWVLYDVPPSATGMSEGVHPAGAHEGKNSWGKTGWGAPCPPSGRHRYIFKLYALDTMLGDIGNPTEADLDKEMQGHVVGQATLTGTYQKQAQ